MHTIAPPSPSAWRILALETRNELLRALRMPMFVIPTLAFPLLFYVMFGIVLNGRSGGEAARYLLATYTVFGIMGPALFGFGVTIAMERAQGQLQLKRALPMPPAVYLLAKLGLAMSFALVVAMLLCTAAAVLGKVVLAPSQWLLLVTIGVLGTLPFCALGLWIGSWASGNGAPAIVNLLYLPMALLSGLWMPLAVLPKVFSMLAPVWPSWHLAQLALKVVGHDDGHAVAMHLAVLAAVTAVFFVLAMRRLARRG